MRCPICGAENAETATFCVACGNRIPWPPPPQPTRQFTVVATGLLAGSSVGYFVGVMSQYWPGPPYLPYLALVYGLGVAVVFVCHLGEHLFPPKTRVYLSPLSVAFAVAYYFTYFGYFFIRAT